MNNNEYRVGVNRGLPVGMGYFSVSFGFGAMAVSQGLKTLDAVLISATNLTSAGQFAGLTLIVAAATLWEMVLTQLVINSRYALMSLALSQRMGEKIGLLPRLLIAFFNTDEIFALAMAREAPLTVPFLLGLGTLPFIGWTLGTLCGALAGSILPSLIIIVCIAAAISSVAGVVEKPWVQGAFRGVIACIVGMVVVTALKMRKKAVKGAVGWLIAAACLVGMSVFGVNPAWLIVGAIALGLLQVTCERLRHPVKKAEGGE